MVERLSYWSRVAPTARLVLAAMAGAAGLGLLPAAAHAQDDDLAAACRASAGDAAAECFLAAAAVRTIHPRVGLALFGGSPLPGSASTLGMRLGSLPRLSLAGRVVVLPMELPPLRNRGTQEGSRALATGLSGQTTVGILSGWSPLPTVGGFLSLDGTVRTSWLLLPGGQGFDDGSVLGASVALRLGLLRESFTLPGISITGSYGRSTGFAFGDPDRKTDGYAEGAVGNWSLTGAATKRVGAVGLTAGASFDRYTGDIELVHSGLPTGATLSPDPVAAETDRWSVFGNISWTFLVLHGSLEAGWQEAPAPEGLPPEVVVDPTGWWVGLALRLSI